MVLLDASESENTFCPQLIYFVGESHTRVGALAIKDTHDGPEGRAMGEGDSHVREVLQLVRDRKFPFPALSIATFDRQRDERGTSGVQVQLGRRLLLQQQRLSPSGSNLGRSVD